MYKKVPLALAGAAALAISGADSAFAKFQATDCNNGSITNVTTGLYLGCEGSFEGNDSNSQEEVMAALGDLSSAFSLEGEWAPFEDHNATKSDSAGNGLFTSNPGDSSGTLTFDEAQKGVFAVSLKAGQFYSLYLFDGGDTGISSFDFDTKGVAQKDGGSDGPGLSHASFFAFSRTTTPDPEPEKVPEPAMLLGLAAVGGVFATKKRKG
jgi:hypothetical protein